MGEKDQTPKEGVTQSLWKKILFSENIFSVVLSWILFITAIALVSKLIELLFGCVSEFGHRYC